MLVRAEPPGTRSCHESLNDIQVYFPWPWVDYSASDGDDLDGDAAEIKRKVGPFDMKMLVEELAVLVEDAQYGRLTLDRPSWDGGTVKGEVGLMSTDQRVLEIRFEYSPSFHDGRRHVRLYFTEPEGTEILLGLKLAAKHPGGFGLDEQDGHTREAGARGEIWHSHQVSQGDQV